MISRQIIGSMTAKGGFLNEKDMCHKFLNYRKDQNAQSWLEIMGYNVKKIKSLTAVQIPPRIRKEKVAELGVTTKKHQETIKYKKADIQIGLHITTEDAIYLENLSLKKANASAGFNQIDKRPVDTYQNMWLFDDEVSYWLKVFTGEITPKKIPLNQRPEILRDKKQRRLFLDEIPTEQFKKITTFFEENKTLILSDLLRGRGGFSAEWLLVTRKDVENHQNLDWVLKDMNTVVNFYAQGCVQISPRGSMKVGKVLMQRKGGTPDPTSLQFKMNPLLLFGDKTC